MAGRDLFSTVLAQHAGNRKIPQRNTNFMDALGLWGQGFLLHADARPRITVSKAQRLHPTSLGEGVTLM